MEMFASCHVDALIFSESFSQNLETQMWGSEITFLTDSNAPGGAGASFQWLGGFRYVNIDSTYNFTLARQSTLQPLRQLIRSIISTVLSWELELRCLPSISL
jgi:hypothetical protein